MLESITNQTMKELKLFTRGFDLYMCLSGSQDHNKVNLWEQTDSTASGGCPDPLRVWERDYGGYGCSMMNS